MKPLHTNTRGWTLYHADYRDTLAAVAAAGGADLIAFSPPYCDARDYGMRVAWGMADYAALGDAVFAALKPGGNAIVNVSAPVRDWAGDGRGTERGLHAFRLAIDWHDRVGFRTPDHLAYGRDGVPGRWSMMFRSGWEPLWWFQRPHGEGYFDPNSIARPAVSAGTLQKKYTGRSKAHSRYVLNGGTWVTPDHKLPTSLWQYGRPNCTTDSSHPARWPSALAEDIVRCFCPPGGLVCDPFVGSGTTALAALVSCRRFVGGDLGFREHDTALWVTVTNSLLEEEAGKLVSSPRVTVLPRRRGRVL